jgi:DNA-binding NarL/FixJ family response regulator
MINVGIVEDHPISRAGLKQFLSGQEDFRVVAEAANGREAIDLVRTCPTLDVLVMDVAMPGQSGLEVLGLIRAKAPHVGILILSGYPAEQYALHLIRQGARGYLNKECEPMEIARAVRAISLGRRYLSPAVAELLAQQLNFKEGGDAPHEQLSQREFQVFLRLAKGEIAGDIAGDLSLSIKTISTYRARVMEKMNLASNSDLTYYALKQELID